MLFELFKNSMRAVVEFHGNNESLPPILVTLVKGKEDLTLRVTQFLFKNLIQFKVKLIYKLYDR
jgi:hypothetical protein